MPDDDIPDYHRGSPDRPRTCTYWPEGKKKVLLVTRGHGFDHAPFIEVFSRNPDIEFSQMEHPAAQLMFDPALARHFDCYVLYDMPGIEFDQGPDGITASFREPPQRYKDGLAAMLEAGHPLVILHHAIAAWPAWPEWAEICGGQFLYVPMKSRGIDKPDSGYAFDARYTVSPAGAHPITEGIEPFEIVDEPYLCEVFEESVIPLFTSDYGVTDEKFYSTRLALQGKFMAKDGWKHEPGSNLVGWVKTYRNSPIVYLQFGDGPSTYGNEGFRRILRQAINWACSGEARDWARNEAGRAS